MKQLTDLFAAWQNEMVVAVESNDRPALMELALQLHRLNLDLEILVTEREDGLVHELLTEAQFDVLDLIGEITATLDGMPMPPTPATPKTSTEPPTASQSAPGKRIIRLDPNAVEAAVRGALLGLVCTPEATL